MRSLVPLTLVYAACCMAQGHAAISSPRPPVDTDSLRAYLTVMLRAYQAGDMDAFQRLANDLKLENAAQWLSHAFGPEQAITMGPQYEASFLSFRSGLERDFQRAGNAAAHFRVEQKHKLPTGVAASPSAPMPRSDVKTVFFRIVMIAQGVGGNEWMDCFVLVDGKLRYVGQGAFPFWAVPPRVRGERVR
jgi:hypothetical protein